MKKLLCVCAALALLVGTAAAQEKKPEPTPPVEGAIMVVPINPPFNIRYSTAAACEAERERIKDSLKTVCIHFK